MDINFAPPNHFSLRCSKIEIFRFAAKLGSERSQVVTRYCYKVYTLSFNATEVGGCTYGLHLKYFIGGSVEIQSDPLRMRVHTRVQFEHHPAEKDE